MAIWEFRLAPGEACAYHTLDAGGGAVCIRTSAVLERTRAPSCPAACSGTRCIRGPFDHNAGTQRRYHTHTRPYAFVNLEASLTQALAPDGGAVGEPAYQEEGQVTFVAHDQLSSHGVRNVGEQTFVQFVVEFK